MHTESPLSNHIIGISTGGGGVRSFDFYQSNFATDHLDLIPPVNTSCSDYSWRSARSTLS
ncbi:hypothetical protein [Methanosarcina siciliae]|uniref:hypothetical protein n=1 Tax=Methanosarcina siciliae TaxID=38027 RepID=UPI000AF5736A|nr:hypothetical protein [Methanosarcina siciliae]